MPINVPAEGEHPPQDRNEMKELLIDFSKYVGSPVFALVVAAPPPQNIFIDVLPGEKLIKLLEFLHFLNIC